MNGTCEKGSNISQLLNGCKENDDDFRVTNFPHLHSPIEVREEGSWK
jgi:hypothetical protein